jgi:flagellar motility protein MotE (MotC chaperone)
LFKEGVMSGRFPFAKSQVQVTLLCFLIVKLGLISIFVCAKRPVFPVPILEGNVALAEDTQEQPTRSRGVDSVSALKASPHTQRRGAGAGVVEQNRGQIEVERQRLEEERKRLISLKEEIDLKIARLEKIQDAIQRTLDEQKSVGDQRIKHLIKIYTTMPPKKAAGLIEKLDMDVIISLFSKMKGENVGQILPYVSAEKAAAISERLAKQGL